MEYLICDFSWFLMSHSLSIFIWFSDSNDFKASHIFSPTATHFRIFTTSWHILLVTHGSWLAPCNLIRCDSSILPWPHGSASFETWLEGSLMRAPVHWTVCMYYIIYIYHMIHILFSALVQVACETSTHRSQWSKRFLSIWFWCYDLRLNDRLPSVLCHTNAHALAPSCPIQQPPASTKA